MNKEYKVTAIILAAGQSRRMGAENKLLKQWQGKPLVEHVCVEAIGSQVSDVVVVTGHQNDQLQKALRKFNVNFVFNNEYKYGVASSIIKGVNAAAKFKCDAVLILLADMPQVTSQIIDALIETAKTSTDQAIILATNKGKRGNPVLWPSFYFDQLMALRGDIGARQLFSNYEDQVVELDCGPGSCFDMDTPEAFRTTL